MGRSIATAALLACACSSPAQPPLRPVSDTGNVDTSPGVDDGADLDRAGGLIIVPPELVFASEASTFTVALDSAPAGPVAVAVASDNERVLIQPSSLTFSPSDWDQPQTLTAAPNLAEFCITGSETALVALQAEGAAPYEASPSAQLRVISQFHVDASFGVTPGAVTLVEGGAPETFEVALNGCIPEGALATLPVQVSDPFEFTASPSSLTFAPSNASIPQAVTLAAVEDACPDPLQRLSVTIGPASGGGLDGLIAPTVDVLIVDNDQVSLSVVPTVLVTSELGTSTTFDVVGTPLDCRDTAATYIDVTADNGSTTEGTITPSTVRLEEANNWTGTFTVTGLDDLQCDGSATYQIALRATSDSPIWDGIAVPPVAVTNSDDDDEGVLVVPTNVMVSEAGGAATVNVSLSGCDPGETVTIDLSNTSALVTVLPPTLSFDSTNFATPQPVTITGVDNADQDGNQVVRIITTMNAAGLYQGVPVVDIDVLVVDDD